MHLMTGQTSAPSGRGLIRTTRCGLTVQTQDATAWWRDVTCPDCLPDPAPIKETAS